MYDFLENEAIVFFLGLCVFFFYILNHKKLKLIQSGKIFIACYGFILMAWLLTNLESFWIPEVMNHLEHLCYTASSVLLLLATWSFSTKRENHNDPHQHF
ncbi:MAG: hypothetical protein JW860_05105 [Sedimentisphaerales bacterium]|nr:hypothetical protein [Sedimentisphaerales bacterium]